MAKVQTGRLADSVAEQLRLDRIEQGQELAQETVHLVYQVSPWLGVRQIGNREQASIDGVVVTLEDHDATDYYGTDAFSSDRQRYWQTIKVEIAGGTVSPILCGVTVRVIGTANDVIIGYKNVVNPGRWRVGPIYVGPGQECLLRTFGNGGLGDALTVWRQGVSAPADGPLPILPGVVSYDE